MNTLESYSAISPSNKTEECAKFVIDDTTEAYVLTGVMTPNREYTFSFWVRSDEIGTVSVGGSIFSSSTDWTYYTVTFETLGVDLQIHFTDVGTYYVYHPQLEIGNKTTDYAPAPEDVVDYVDNTYLPREEGDSRLVVVESLIQQLSESISMVVAGLESISFMEQTEDGWTFGLGSVQESLDKASNDLKALNDEIGSTNDTITALSKSVNDLNTYVKIREYEGEPCIELGAGESDFKLLITNTRIMFMEGSAMPTYISNQTMYIDKLRVETELQQGDFVWTQRANGNLGLMWKEATS